jgi:hypothetical protein
MLAGDQSKVSKAWELAAIFATANDKGVKGRISFGILCQRIGPDFDYENGMKLLKAYRDKRLEEYRDRPIACGWVPWYELSKLDSQPLTEFLAVHIPDDKPAVPFSVNDVKRFHKEYQQRLYGTKEGLKKDKQKRGKDVCCTYEEICHRLRENMPSGVSFWLH